MADQPAAVSRDALDADTRWQVSEVLSRYGHIIDNQEWAYLAQVFTPDATLDAQGLPAAQGLAGIRRFLEPHDPWRSHHTLNTATRWLGDGNEISALSRFLVVEATGTTISGDYVDVLTSTADGWRIRSRRISLRNRAGQAPGGQPWRTESFSAWTAE